MRNPIQLDGFLLALAVPLNHEEGPPFFSQWEPQGSLCTLRHFLPSRIAPLQGLDDGHNKMALL